MLTNRSVNEFRLIVPSIAPGTRPALAPGTLVTPVQNATNGTYAQLLSGGSVTSECQEIEIEINTVGISGTARDGLVTIGFDLAGGTSYTDKIVDLVAGPAGPHLSGNFVAGGVFYRFPLRIPSGCSIGAKASVNSTTLTAIRVSCVLRGKPTHPESIYVGSFVTTFGDSTSTSAGTAITPGTTSEGAWTQIGSALATELRYWEVGLGVNNAVCGGNFCNVDVGIGDGSNKRVVISNAGFYLSNAETQGKFPNQGRHAVGAIGDLVYVRSQVGPNAPDLGYTTAVYGVGG